MAWSNAAGGFYIFGGYDGSSLNDLYLYVREAGKWWQLETDGAAPSRRYRHSMAWSDAAGGFYIFGGYGEVGSSWGLLNDLYFAREVAVVNITSNEGSNPNVTKPKAAVDFALIVLGLSVGASCCLLVVVCFFYKRRLLSQEAARKKKDFKLDNPLAVKNLLLYADVRPVRYKFLEEILRAGKPWTRRQEAQDMNMEDGQTALVTREELESLWYDADKRRFYQTAEGTVEVHLFSVSHIWEAMEHPDAWRYQLQETVRGLQHLDGLVWVFFDYTSLYQYPRATEHQRKSFQRALEHMHLLYAHDGINVLIIDQPTEQATKQMMEQEEGATTAVA
ncbi:unnamed protein product [Durusdinium trenchii]|uniref:Uncharacterized protein n=1 Tax=Durusdinium trenchii TaxID=1381693 RepID=A0ABP0INA9_9DINO